MNGCQPRILVPSMPRRQSDSLPSLNHCALFLDARSPLELNLPPEYGHGSGCGVWRGIDGQDLKLQQATYMLDAGVQTERENKPVLLRQD